MRILALFGGATTRLVEALLDDDDFCTSDTVPALHHYPEDP